MLDPSVPNTSGRWKRLGDMLMDAGLLTQGQLSEGLAEKERSKCFLGQALVKLGYLTQDELILFLVKQCKIPHINLIDYRIDPQVVRTLPDEMCLRYQLMAIDRIGNILTVCMVNPLDIDALEEARNACPTLKIKPILCTPEHFEIVARQHLVGLQEGGEPAPKPALSLSSFGLSPAAAPKAKVATPAPPAAISTTGPFADESYAILVREVLNEVLNTFQSPRFGQENTDDYTWESDDQYAPQFTFTIDSKGTVCYVSPAITKMLGYAPADFQVGFLNLLTGHPTNALLRQSVALSLSGCQRAPVEVEFLAKDGTPRMVMVALFPVFDADEKLVAVQGVARDVDRRAAVARTLYHATTHDALTGLLNLKSFLSRLHETIQLAKRHNTPVSIAVVNVDGFTQVNESHGHQEGNNVIRQLGKILRDSLRGEDIVAHSGGDEFCILMRHVSPEHGFNGIKRYREALTAAKLVTTSGIPLKLYVTAGLSTLITVDDDPDQLLEIARSRVQKGKMEGGNCVVLT